VRNEPSQRNAGTLFQGGFMDDTVELGSPGELEKRVALVRPEDTMRGFFFAAALKAIRNQGDEAAVNRCLEAVGREQFLAFFRYPIAPLLRLLYVASWSLSGTHGGFEGALRYLGRQAAPDFLESPMGRILLKLAGNEPRRLFGALPSAYRALMRHGECSVGWTGMQSGVIRFKGNVIPPPYFEGAVRTVFEAMKKTGVEVEWASGRARRGRD
jgi:uncharacterized protein (TIGR02265 family)